MVDALQRVSAVLACGTGQQGLEAAGCTHRWVVVTAKRAKRDACGSQPFQVQCCQGWGKVVGV